MLVRAYLANANNACGLHPWAFDLSNRHLKNHAFSAMLIIICTEKFAVWWKNSTFATFPSNGGK
jgi:hypothetical protein